MIDAKQTCRCWPSGQLHCVRLRGGASRSTTPNVSVAMGQRPREVHRPQADQNLLPHWSFGEVAMNVRAGPARCLPASFRSASSKRLSTADQGKAWCRQLHPSRRSTTSSIPMRRNLRGHRLKAKERQETRGANGHGRRSGSSAELVVEPRDGDDRPWRSSTRRAAPMRPARQERHRARSIKALEAGQITVNGRPGDHFGFVPRASHDDPAVGRSPIASPVRRRCLGEGFRLSARPVGSPPACPRR